MESFRGGKGAGESRRRVPESYPVLPLVFGIREGLSRWWMVHYGQYVPVLIFMHRPVSLGVINQQFKIPLKCFKHILAAGKMILNRNAVKNIIT